MFAETWQKLLFVFGSGAVICVLNFVITRRIRVRFSGKAQGILLFLYGLASSLTLILLFWSTFFSVTKLFERDWKVLFVALLQGIGFALSRKITNVCKKQMC